MAEPLEDTPRDVQDTPRKRRIGRILLDAAAQVVLSFSGFTLGFLWWFIKWTFAAVAFMAIMAGTGLYVFNQATAAGNHVTVPNITNMPLAQAVLVLQERDLGLGEPERVSSKEPEYQVIAQRPPAGSVVRAGRKVYPTISVSDPHVVPNLVGVSIDGMTQEALASLTHGFPINQRPARVPHDQPRGTVIAQDPPAGQKVSEPVAISLLVSEGASPELFLMPDLVGRRVEEVARLLKPLGVSAEASPIEAEEDQPYNVVLAQSPPAGTWVHEGMKVVYKVRAAAREQVAPTEYVRQFSYTEPFSWSDRTIRLDFVDKAGQARTVEYGVRGGEGKNFRFEMRYPDETTVNVYRDGKRVESYYYKGNNEPIKRTF